jgi:hypothetical protein
MSTDSLPDTPPALIQSTSQSPVLASQLLSGNGNSVARSQSWNPRILKADTNPEHPHSPLYLKTCCLIC